MPRFVCLLQLFIVASLLSGGACGGKGKLTGTAGAGGGGRGGSGHGGTSGSGGGAPITSCPASMPTAPNGACSGSLGCQFNAGCTCHGCCMAFWSCVDGIFKQTDFNDGCGQGPPCEDGGAGTSGMDGSGGDGGRGGSSGVAGVGGSHGGTGGGMAGAGGAPITSCPAARPVAATMCSGALDCYFDQRCTCRGCCFDHWSCVNGAFASRGYDDGCVAGSPCPDAGAVCTFGADQTCNDNPILSSIHGHCTDAGTCACTFDAGTNPDSGRCL